MRHPKEKIEKIIELRKRGYSIIQIMRELSLSKTTVWNHINKISLSKKYLDILKSNQGGSHKRRLARLERANKEAGKLLRGSLKYYSLILAMLYWAEGNKKGFVFTNTDSRMVKMFVKILREVFCVGNDRIDVAVRYFTGMDKKKCIDHWSVVTGVDNIRVKTYYNDGGTKGKNFGICRVTVLRGEYLQKVVWAIVDRVCNGIF